MSKIKNFKEFLKEEVYVQPQPAVQQTQPPVQNSVQPTQSQPEAKKLDPTKVNKKIDFTYLNKDANVDKIRQICETAKSPENLNYIFGVVVGPEFVSETKKYLEDSGIKTITVISYPDGDDKNSIKMKALQKAISEGAEEVNVVMDYKKLTDALIETDKEKQEKMIQTIQTDIRSLVEYCKERSTIIKIIIEMEALSDTKTISKAVEICKKTNVDFITTSTGMYTRNTNYTFEKKMKDVTEVIVPMIEGMDDININVCGGVNGSDKLMLCLSNNKIQRISSSMTPQTLLNKQSPPPQTQIQSPDSPAQTTQSQPIQPQSQPPQQ
jgi:deoxyribose-phosphate aldolase